MNIGSIVRGLLGDSKAGEAKSVELKEGQVVRGVVLSVSDSGHEAVVQIQGTPVKAELETPLQAGQTLNLQVGAPGQNGLPVLKAVAGDGVLSSPQNMGEALKSLGLTEAKGGYDIVRAMVTGGLGLNKETADTLASVLSAKPANVSTEEWLGAAVLSLKRGLPVTPESVKGLQQAVFGPKLHDLLAKLEAEVAVWAQLDAAGEGEALPSAGRAAAGASGSAGQPSGAGSSGSGAQAAGTPATPAAGPGTGTAQETANGAGTAKAAVQAAGPGNGTATGGGAAAELLAGADADRALQSEEGAPEAKGAAAGTGAAGINADEGGEASARPAGTVGGAAAGAAAGATASETGAPGMNANGAGTAAGSEISAAGAKNAGATGAGAAGAGNTEAGRIATGEASHAGATGADAAGAGGTAPRGSSAGLGGTPAAAGPGAAANGGGAADTDAASPGAAAGNSAAAEAAARTVPAPPSGTALLAKLQGVLTELRGTLPQLGKAPAAAQAGDTAPPEAAGQGQARADAAPRGDSPAAAAQQPVAAPARDVDAWVGRVLKLLGAEHEQQAVRGGGAAAAGKAAGADDAGTLKGTLLQLAGSSEVPPAVKEAAGQLVQQLTGQQLLLNTDRTAPFAQVTLFLPLKGEDGRETASVQIQSRRGRKGELDAGNCRLWFDLDMKQLGRTLVDVQVVDRIVSLKLHNDEPWVQELLEGRREEIRSAVESIGYQLSGLRTEPLPAPAAQDASETAGKLADYVPDAYKGVDYRI
ncbi:hypothetical protein [Paenibacillus sp. NFR01]|uniref:hypothetical protein n=1 Tax=Paenibacillus sp. NFR01 TaxID=1566279 RepID=UPI0008D6F697|nr:hypothetical protein [Paenibacillus sp. NFR01]SET44483.1 hypothetical protein SAMN03159358_1697 [Paenibacillus sp. NFR01]